MLQEMFRYILQEEEPGTNLARATRSDLNCGECPKTREAAVDFGNRAKLDIEPLRSF